MPTVSVVIATYNRSNVLRYTLRSLVMQTFADWEAWVIGDACTDDTAQVVASIGDPRITFVNLENNHGEQSAPNNEGVRRSRGAYVAYLNHDDLWFPDHLASALEVLEAGEADLAFGLLDIIDGAGHRTLGGAVPGGSFQPHNWVPASAWVMKRALFDRAGPWRSYTECFDAPSQDWLRRAWRAGARIRQVPKLTVVALPSGGRPRSYSERQDVEHRDLFEQLSGNPSFREQELQQLLLDAAVVDPRRGNDLAVRLYLERGLKNVLRRVLLWFGLSPNMTLKALRYRRKGAFLRRLRKRRGLGDPG